MRWQWLVFTPDFILSAFHLLVDKLLPLTSTDLEALEDEPEEWLIGENTDEEAWAFEFRVSQNPYLYLPAFLTVSSHARSVFL